MNLDVILQITGLYLSDWNYFGGNNDILILINIKFFHNSKKLSKYSMFQKPQKTNSIVKFSLGNHISKYILL